MISTTLKELVSKSPVLASTADLSSVATFERGYITVWHLDGSDYLPSNQMLFDADANNGKTLLTTARGFLDACVKEQEARATEPVVAGV